MERDSDNPSLTNKFMSLQTGKHIALYGIPKCGKTTQADILVQTLKRKEYRAEYLKYPIFEHHPTGFFLNEYLNKGKHKGISERELQLWFTLNRVQYQPTLKTRLEEERTFIISENYTGMSVAYGMLAGVDQQWLETVNDLVAKPSIGIVINSERAIDRTTPQEGKTLRELQGIYNKLATRHAWYVIDGDKKMMEVHMLIWDIIKKIL